MLKPIQAIDKGSKHPMERRSLLYSDTQSNKFWTITLDGDSHTVQYGRVGTNGQNKTKTFDSEAKARQSFEKLLQGKLTKGYVEQSIAGQEADGEPGVAAADSETDSSSAQHQTGEDVSKAPSGQTPAATSVTPPAAAPSTSTSIKTSKTSKTSPAAIPTELDVSRHLNLSPQDWQRATWRPWQPLPQGKPVPFDQEKCQKRLNTAGSDRPPSSKRYPYQWGWKHAKIAGCLTVQEARFWMMAMYFADQAPLYLHHHHEYNLFTAVTHRLEQVDVTQPVADAEILEMVIRMNALPAESIIPLATLTSLIKLCIKLTDLLKYDADSLVDVLQAMVTPDDLNITDQSHYGRARRSVEQIFQSMIRDRVQRHVRDLVSGFKTKILPYLSLSEIEQYREELETALSSGDLPLQALAAYLGMHTPVEQFVGTLTSVSSYRQNRFQQVDVVLGLGSAQSVSQAMRRLNFLLIDPEEVRAWLAHTEYQELDWICRSIVESYDSYYSPQAKLLKAFVQSVIASEAAPHMLEVWMEMKKSQLAREWLDEHPSHAIVGLIPVVTGQIQPVKAQPKAFKRAAIRYLQGLVRKGYKDLIKQALAQQSPEIEATIRETVLAQAELPGEPFNEATTPDWLQTGLAEWRQRKAVKEPGWITPEDLPPLLTGSHRLNDEQVGSCLAALSQSSLGQSPSLLVRSLKTHLDTTVLDDFVWALFERWLMDGADSKQKWAMIALGLLGSDAIALKLTPLIREWPGQSQHPRAVLGLECLRAIGSDTALMQISGIANKIKYKGLKKRAKDCLMAIAAERQLTPDELSDRIIPDCGLDPQGHRTFDFGARQFEFVLGQDLKPYVRDAKGKLKTTLPKPGVKDDGETATQAIADWKLMKKQISEVVKLQTIRLEQAMILQRRWPWADFQSLLITHPVMTHVVQRVVWIGFESDGAIAGTFRIAEDCTLANADDEEFDAGSLHSVGIVHPIQLNATTLTAWGEQLSDYEIIPPFPQINRDQYTLTEAERTAEEITRFNDQEIKAITLSSMMEKFGWSRGQLADHGDYSCHYRYFPAANITAITGDYEHQLVDRSVDIGDDAIDGCCFAVGQYEPYDYPLSQWGRREARCKILPLAQVDPIVMSEVLRDLSAIAAKAQS